MTKLVIRWGWLGCSPRRETRGCAFTTSGAQHRNAPQPAPARRVAAYSGVCGVARLANGTTIRRASRLASIPNTQQRIPNLPINEPCNKQKASAEQGDGHQFQKCASCRSPDTRAPIKHHVSLDAGNVPGFEVRHGGVPQSAGAARWSGPCCRPLRFFALSSPRHRPWPAFSKHVHNG